MNSEAHGMKKNSIKNQYMKHGSVRNNEEPRRKENTAHQSTVKPLTGINSERFELGSKSTFYSFKLFFSRTPPCCLATYASPGIGKALCVHQNIPTKKYVLDCWKMPLMCLFLFSSSLSLSVSLHHTHAWGCKKHGIKANKCHLKKKIHPREAESY